ncbi:MAG: hypothetical protein QGH45_02295 [Myxococcota bacterium]|nr:hypothetical protein [Myxococcota bacterium]
MGALVAILATLAGGSGCVGLRSQLKDPVPADEATAELARAVLAARPLPTERRAQIAMEWGDKVFVALGFFAVQPPDSYHAELATPFGVTLLEVARGAEATTIESGASGLQRMVGLGELPRTLALWLLGTCEDGPVLQGLNAVAIDCAAGGPDQGLVWRLWLDPASLGAGVDSTPADPRVRGELLRGKKLLADFICQPDGDCLLQDPVHGYVLRIVTGSTPSE